MVQMDSHTKHQRANKLLPKVNSRIDILNQNVSPSEHNGLIHTFVVVINLFVPSNCPQLGHLIVPYLFTVMSFVFEFFPVSIFFCGPRCIKLFRTILWTTNNVYMLVLLSLGLWYLSIFLSILF